MYFINCVQICGCWQRDVSDTVRCAWQWWQQTVLQHQWGAAGCLYCENMFWGNVSLSGSEITKHAVSANNTTQHPSYINSNNLRFRTVPSITATVCFTVSVLGMCCINWRYYGNTVIILSDNYRLQLQPTYLSGVWKIHWAGHVRTIKVTNWSGNGGHLMKPYRCAHLLIFGAVAQYRYSAVKGNELIVIKCFVKACCNKHGQYFGQCLSYCINPNVWQFFSKEKICHYNKNEVSHVMIHTS